MSLFISGETKPLGKASGWTARMFEVTTQDRDGFSGLIAIEPPNRSECIRINWKATYLGEGGWRILNEKTSATILYDAKVVDTALHMHVEEHLNAWRKEMRKEAERAREELKPKLPLPVAEQAIIVPEEAQQGEHGVGEEKIVVPTPPIAEQVPKEHRKRIECAKDKHSTEMQTVVCLTQKQRDVAALFAQDLTYVEIAKRLNISVVAVGRRIEKVYNALGIHNRTELRMLVETPHVKAGDVPLFFPAGPTKKKERESCEVKRGGISTPVNRLLNLLVQAQRTGVEAVDKANELIRYIEFCKGILPAGYMLTYKIGTDASGRTSAEIAIQAKT